MFRRSGVRYFFLFLHTCEPISFLGFCSEGFIGIFIQNIETTIIYAYWQYIYLKSIALITRATSRNFRKGGGGKWPALLEKVTRNRYWCSRRSFFYSVYSENICKINCQPKGGWYQAPPLNPGLQNNIQKIKNA